QAPRRGGPRPAHAVPEPVRGLPRDRADAAAPDARARLLRAPRAPARRAAVPPRDARRGVRDVSGTAGDGWVEACAVDDIEEEDVIEVECAGRAIAVYRSPQDTFHATDALCTHERASLADGLVQGDIIECPKHNGRFNYKTGEAKR